MPVAEQQELSFTSEEEKISALDKLPDTPENLAEIDRVMNAPVRETPEGTKDAKPKEAEEAKPEDQPAEEQTPTPKAEEKPAGESQKPNELIQIPLSELPEEYRTFDNAGKLLKKIKNQDETISRQTSFIREKLQTQAVSPSTDEIERIRRENEELRRQIQAGQRQGGEAGAPAERKVEASQGKLTEIVSRRKALYHKFSDPEDRQFNAEFLKERDALEEMQFEELGHLNTALAQVRSEINETKRQAQSAVEYTQQFGQKGKDEEEFTNQIKEIESFTAKNPEFKLSKPFMEIDKEYAEYQEQVASIYWGRKPSNKSETQVAMNQLQRRSPDLLNKLQAAQIETSPTQDMERYLATCEIWDAWQGIRKDPLTGDFHRDKNGRIVPMTRYDPLLKTEVPDRYPSAESAYNDLQVRSGYYTNKVVEAFKKGGQSAAEARGKRDGGAVEMDNATGGKPKQTSEQALDLISKIDERAAMMAARAGDTTLLNRYNELATVVGWPLLEV